MLSNKCKKNEINNIPTCWLYIKLHLCCSLFPRSRNCIWIFVWTLTTNTHPPTICNWGVTDEGLLLVAKSESSPRFTTTSELVIQMYWLISFNGAWWSWVWCLKPIVTAPQKRIDDLEMKHPVLSPESLQLFQSGEQFGTGVVSILAEGLFIRLNGIFSTRIFKWTMITSKSPPMTSCENTLIQ